MNPGEPGCVSQRPDGSRGREGVRGGQLHVPASSALSHRSYQLPAIAALQLGDQG